MEFEKLSTNPVGVILQLVGAKWKILIIRELLKKDKRFSELKKTLGCTSKVLSICLKELEQDGIVIREKVSESTNTVEYYLTDIGYSMRPVIEAMQKWGSEYKKYRKLIEKAKRS